MALIGEFGAARAAADETREPDTFRFFGEDFTVSDDIGSMPLLRYAHAAASGMDSAEIEGMAAMHDLLRDCLAEGEWPRFQDVATKNKARDDDFLNVCRAVYQAIAGRPTRRPSDSSAGPLSTGASSRELSSSDESSTLSPIMRDPRVQELQLVTDAGRDVLAISV